MRQCMFHRSASVASHASANPPFPHLTAREQSCLRWIAQGKTSWETGVILGLSERTVNFHVHNLCRKMGVHKRQSAIALALQAGLLADLPVPPAIDLHALPTWRGNVHPARRGVATETRRLG